MDETLNDPERLRWERQNLSRARGGDRAAMAELYRTYADRLYSRVLLPRLGDPDAAVDALSETFRVAFEKIDQFEEQRTSIYFWLSRIAMNKATDMHRARAVTGRVLTRFLSMVGPIIEPAVRPDEALEERDDAERALRAVEQVLGALNPRYARAIRLRFFEERSRQEAAAELDVTVGTFDVVLLRALRSFKKVWTEQIGETPE